MDRDHSGFFQGQQGPRRQWQYRGEVQAARDARRMRLWQLVGSEGVTCRVATRAYRGCSALMREIGWPADLDGEANGLNLSQRELAERLTAEGHPCSQSTVSRDLFWLLAWMRPEVGMSEGELDFYRAHPELARPLSPLERVAGHPIRAPNERGWGRAYREHLSREAWARAREAAAG